MNRFFVDKNNILEDKGYVIIDHKEDVKHIEKVLRLKEEDEVEICDKENMEYICKIMSIEKTQVKLKILQKRYSPNEPSIEVTLFQGIPKSSKMELIIQKCTELGLNKIVPIITHRTIVQLKDEKAEEKKLDRWQKIADEAAKQCKRGIIPQVLKPIAYEEILNMVKDYDRVIIPYEEEKNNGIKTVLKSINNPKKIAIVIGPEGGFEEDEIKKATEGGISSVSLGPRILRTETAGFTALTIVMYELGDLGGN